MTTNLEYIRVMFWFILILYLVFQKKHISINNFWLMIITSVIMIFSGISEIVYNPYISSKSIGFIIGHILVIYTFYSLIKSGVTKNKRIQNMQNEINKERSKI